MAVQPIFWVLMSGFICRETKGLSGKKLEQLLQIFNDAYCLTRNQLTFNRKDCMPRNSSQPDSDEIKGKPYYNPDQKVKKPWQAWLGGSPVLIISILVHVLFLALALYFVVQRIHEKRKQTFTEVSVSKPVQQLEQKVQLTQMKQAQSSPEVTQKIATLEISNVNLPPVDLPSENPGEGTAKMGPASLGTGSGNTGNGSGAGGAHVDLDVDAIAMSSFGIPNGAGLGLPGRLYDLKQTSNRMATDMDNLKYAKVVGEFTNSGWPDDFFKGYFKSPKLLYLPQLFMPYMNASDGPKAFEAQNDVKPKLWVVVYKGRIVLPKGGSYRFVGFGDDACVVALNKKTIFDGSWRGPQSAGINHPPTGTYVYSFPTSLNFGTFSTKFMCGDWVSFNADQPYNIEILVGERPGGYCGFWLMVEQQYHTYAKTPQGSPILPLFKLSNVKMPSTDIGCPPFAKDEDLGWKVLDDSGDAPAN